jgi:hypothetical protein
VGERYHLYRTNWLAIHEHVKLKNHVGILVSPIADRRHESSSLC